jgi:hypothetical protein
LGETIEGVAEERFVMVQASEFGIMNIETEDNSTDR